MLFHENKDIVCSSRAEDKENHKLNTLSTIRWVRSAKQATSAIITRNYNVLFERFNRHLSLKIKTNRHSLCIFDHVGFMNNF